MDDKKKDTKQLNFKLDLEDYARFEKLRNGRSKTGFFRDLMEAYTSIDFFRAEIDRYQKREDIMLKKWLP